MPREPLYLMLSEYSFLTNLFPCYSNVRNYRFVSLSRRPKDVANFKKPSNKASLSPQPWTETISIYTYATTWRTLCSFWEKKVLARHSPDELFFSGLTGFQNFLGEKEVSPRLPLNWPLRSLKSAWRQKRANSSIFTNKFDIRTYATRLDLS